MNNKKDAQEEVNKNLELNGQILNSNKELIADLKQQGYKSVIEPDGTLRFVRIRQAEEMCSTSFQAPYNFFLEEKDFDKFFGYIKY